jgi:hypothetical protein
VGRRRAHSNTEFDGDGALGLWTPEKPPHPAAARALRQGGKGSGLVFQHSDAEGQVLYFNILEMLKYKT